MWYHSRDLLYLWWRKDGSLGTEQLLCFRREDSWANTVTPFLLCGTYLTLCQLPNSFSFSSYPVRLRGQQYYLATQVKGKILTTSSHMYIWVQPQANQLRDPLCVSTRIHSACPLHRTWTPTQENCIHDPWLTLYPQKGQKCPGTVL